MYELYEKFKCSKCNSTFACIEILDTDITKDQVTIKCSGYCDECEQYEDWIMIYQLKKVIKMNEERHWIITFSNGHCGCGQEEEFIGTYEGAVDYANERLREYAENMSNAVFDWDEEINEDEYEEYCENCYYEIEESEEED